MSLLEQLRQAQERGRAAGEPVEEEEEEGEEGDEKGEEAPAGEGRGVKETSDRSPARFTSPSRPSPAR